MIHMFIIIIYTFWARSNGKGFEFYKGVKEDSMIHIFELVMTYYQL